MITRHKHTVSLEAYVRPTRIDMELSDADGLLIEVAANVNLTNPQVIYSSRSRLHDVDWREAADEQRGTETVDAHGLLVEVTHDLDPDSESLSSVSASKHTKIINGKSTQRTSYPFIVRLHSFDPGSDPDNSPKSFYCSGTLISPDIILTAAHCMNDEVYADIYSVERKKTITYKIAKSVVHPKYQMIYFGHDFALARIDRTHIDITTNTNSNYENSGEDEYWGLVNDFNWVSNPPIMRLHRYDQHSSSCTTLSRAESKQVISNFKVLGFGLLSFPKGPISYPSLQSANLDYLPNEECNEMYLKAPPTAVASKEEGVVVTNDMLCANNVKERQDACSGDSGGPLLAKLSTSNKPILWSLIGIVSWGIGCSLPNYPGVYSRVASEIDWIESTICDKTNGLSPMSCITDGNGRYHLRDHAIEASSRNGSKTLSSRHSSVVSQKRVQLNLSFSVSGTTRQSHVNKKACELLEGSYVKSSPTRQPTSRLQNGRPTKLDMGLSISCHRNNQYDVKSFIDDNNKVRNCYWVKRKCRRRCLDYSSCCPETCSQKRCQQ